MAKDQNKDLYRLLFEFSMDAVLYTSTDGTIFAANPAACQLFKYSETQICSMGRHGLVDLSESAQLERMLKERAKDGKTEGELIYNRSDGTRFVGWTSSAVFFDEAGSQKSVIIVRDLTEAKKKEAALLQSIGELDDLYNYAPCGYHSVDAEGAVVKMNKTELSWLGYEKEDVIGKPFKNYLTPESRKIYSAQFEQYKQSGHQKDLELELVQKNGDRRPVLLNSTAIFDEHSTFVMSRTTLVDLTDRKKLDQELQRQAHMDFLTGLNNRGNFNELAQREFATCRRLNTPLGFLFFDIDNFKQINDTYGHHAGDLVLRAVGDCCLKTLREIDILGRWGGEEFVALLPGLKSDDIRDTAERLRVALSEIEVDVQQAASISFTVSIGASCLKSKDSSVNSLMRRADIALYSAKSNGKNCVFIDSDILN